MWLHHIGYIYTLRDLHTLTPLNSPFPLDLSTPLVAHIAISVSDQVQQVEADSEQKSAQEVTEGGQVGDGEVVGVAAARPQVVHHPHG